MLTGEFPESLSGLIERVTYFNEENGFAVLRVKVKGNRDLLTVVGSLPSATPGEWVHAEGRWVQDRQFGPQFRADLLKSSPPTSREGVEKYLGSGLIKGIGPVYAKKLIARFGEEIFDVIDRASARLEEVDGIGPKRRRQIKEAWAEQKVVRGIMVFLHSHGVGTSRAVRIYKTYGEQAVDKVRANPYVLARDIAGIGFKTADQIAQRVGIPANSLARAGAALLHLLLEASEAGHCALPRERLLEQATDLLGVGKDLAGSALARALESGELIKEMVANEELIFIPRFKRAEEEIARRMSVLARAPVGYPPVDLGKALAWFEQKSGTQLAPSQQAALGQALHERVMILTGGPGVGKTTLVNAILMILRAKKVRCQLCAPTGRAAKRLAEATGLEAKTIHRLLEVQGSGHRFGRDERRPLECDLLVVDECSMIDVLLMQHLLRAFPAGAGLLLVGDADQLPSVGPGLVLSHLIESGVVPVVRLTEVFRQAERSRIVVAAHRIRQGLPPEAGAEVSASDFHFIERPDPEDILRTLLEVVKRRIPARFHWDAIGDIQVLSPMNRGLLGVRELNRRLQAELNPMGASDVSVEKFGWQFRVGDKVIQTRNDYDKEVFNGDIGRVVRIDPLEREVAIQFDRREVVYDYGELDEIALAYAITIHKAQGSEFQAVVIPLAMQQFLLLQRNLIYTGITRGKRFVVLIGQRKALALAVHNNHPQLRYSGLLSRLKAA